MNSFTRLFLAAAAMAISSADAAAFVSTTVVCVDDMDEVCVGNSFFTTPSPGTLCEDPSDPSTCETIYEGGWSWEYNFIEGYEEGTDLSLEDPDDVTAAETGLVISIMLEDDATTCEIMVGNETCAECSAVGCTGLNVTYDCTNVDMGAMSMECEPLEPIFYPLEMFNSTGGTDDEAMGVDADSSSHMAMAKVLLAALVAGATGLFAL